MCVCVFLSAKACLQHLFEIGLPAGFGWGKADFDINEKSQMARVLSTETRCGIVFFSSMPNNGISPNMWGHKLSSLSSFLLKPKITITISHYKSNWKSRWGVCHGGSMIHAGGVAWCLCTGGLRCAGLVPPALAACDAIVLLCSFSQVLVHCSPEFSETCCIDIQGLFLIPITALSLSFCLSLSLFLFLSLYLYLSPSFRNSLPFSLPCQR